MRTDRHYPGRAKSLLRLVLPIVALILASCGGQDALDGLPTATVVAVRDGDTIELSDGRVVRYCGVDTPERGRPWADSATVFNASLVVGKTVRLEQGDDRIDRYGRTLAFVFVDQKMVNMELLKAGLAWCYFFEGNLKYGPDMVRATRQAMRDGRGMWAEMPPGDEDHYVGSFRGFRFHRPICPNAAQIKLDDVRTFAVRDSAFFAGYSPCKTCAP